MIITINSITYSSDWYYTKQTEVDLDKIRGFIIHCCHDSTWMLEVETLEKNENGSFITYKIEGTVWTYEIIKLLDNNAPIVRIENHMSNLNMFMDRLKKLWVK